jgi:hypothetical protein
VVDDVAAGDQSGDVGSCEIDGVQLEAIVVARTLEIRLVGEHERARPVSMQQAALEAGP